MVLEDGMKSRVEVPVPNGIIIKAEDLDETADKNWSLLPSWIMVQPIKQRILIKHTSPQDREITEEITLKNLGSEDIQDFPIPLADFLHGIIIYDEDDSRLPFYARHEINIMIGEYECALKDRLEKQLKEGALVWVKLPKERPIRQNQLRTIRLTFAGTNEMNPRRGVTALSLFDKKTYVDYVGQVMPIETSYFITAPKGFALEIVSKKTAVCNLGGSRDEVISITNRNPTAPNLGVDLEEMRPYLYTVTESYISAFLVPPSIKTTLNLNECYYRGKFIEGTGQLKDNRHGNGIANMPILLSIVHKNGQKDSLSTFTKADGLFSFSLEAACLNTECKVKAHFADNSYFVGASSQEKTIESPSNRIAKSKDIYTGPSNSSSKSENGEPVYVFRLEYEVKLTRLDRLMWTLVILSLSLFFLLLLMPYVAEAVNSEEGINLPFGIKIPTSHKIFSSSTIHEVTIVGLIALAGAAVGSMIAANNPLLRRTTVIGFILALSIALLGSYGLMNIGLSGGNADQVHQIVSSYIISNTHWVT
jgi:hypothetical protein